MNIVFSEPIGFTLDQKKEFSDEMTVLGHFVSYYDNPPTDEEDLYNRSKDAAILVVSNYKVSTDTVKRLSELKMIAVAFTGVDHIPLDLCRGKGIVVSNAAGYSTQAVAELTISLAIDLFRKIVPFDSITRSSGTRSGYLGSELRGKVFGIVGFGAIGQRVAMLAQAFECKVMAFSRTKKQLRGVEFVELDDLLAKSDIISIHLPLNDTTRGLINENKLALMKKTAVLINTARGPIVDSAALSKALKQGIIAGAAVDVYEHEPPIESNHTLFDAPNTILLPHIGFATKEAIDERSRIVINNIKAWLEGNPVNRV